jgi:hypothetical protein
MIVQALLSIVPNIVGRIADHFRHKREVKNAVAIKKLEMIQARDMADTNWEMEQARNSNESWKDEFWTVVFGFLLLIPLYDPTKAAVVFEHYAKAPEWFQLCVLVSVGASFGVKIWKGLKTG